MSGKKLFETLSKRQGKTVEVLGVSLTFDRFTLRKHGEYEERGFSLTKISEDMKEDVFKVSEMIFDLLNNDAKAEFDNSYEVFKEVVDFQTLMDLAHGFMDTIMEAQYISEKKGKAGKK